MSDINNGKLRAYPVRGEMSKQIGVVLLITALGIWQSEFVYHAAASDIYLFALLFGAGTYGIYQAIHGTHKLANEFDALGAMKQIYDDAQRNHRHPTTDLEPLIERVKQPAILYYPPSALGTAHNLIIEEIQRSGAIRISAGTMQVLVADLETKLDDRQGMSHYLGALMVLLGLLGTFIGLMHTLESVGGILGSLDLSGSAGASAIAGLIESLKRPLEGMSTGFGASLFGLIGSLVIGLMGKFDTKASFRLKHEFETWIRSAVQIEGMTSGERAEVATPGGSAPGQQGAQADQLHSLTMLRVARSTVATTSKLAQQIGQLTSVVQDTRHEVAQQKAQTEEMARALGRASSAQIVTARGIEALLRSVSMAQERFGSVADQVTTSLVEQRAATMSLIGEVSGELRAIRETLDAGVNRIDDAREDLASLETGITAMAGTIATRLDKLGTAAEPAQEPELARLVAELDHLISVSRLEPRDIANLRRLAAVFDEAGHDNSVGRLQARLGAIVATGSADAKAWPNAEAEAHLQTGALK